MESRCKWLPWLSLALLCASLLVLPSWPAPRVLSVLMITGSPHRAPARALSENPLCLRYAPAPAAGALWRLPPLFDFSRLPTPEQTCAHCPGDDSLATHCCGVCEFNNRFCEEHHPGEGIAERAVAELAGLGYALHSLTPCELWLRLRGRTLWLMGDSQSWHYYQAVECFLHPYAVDYRRRNVTNDPELRLKLRPVTEPVQRYARCLHLQEGGRVCNIRADNASTMIRDIWPTLRELEGERLPADVMVFNLGLHHPPDEHYQQQLAQAAEFITANRAWLPRMVWMDTPPQHFNTSDGAYIKGENLMPCVAMQPDSPIIQQGGLHNIAARPYVSQLGEGHLQLWAPTVPLYYTHLKRECTHYCQPGPYQLWTYLLNQVLRDAGLGNQLGGSEEQR